MDEIEEAPAKINFIPCIKWVKRGVAKENPEKVTLTKEELIEVITQTKSKLRHDSEEGEGQDEEVSTSQTTGAPENTDEFKFAEYDDEDENDDALGIGNLAIVSENEEHENLVDSDSENEDDIIKSTDNLILVGHIEGDASILEVYVYNEAEESLFVHHDILLPSFPLCLEWLDYEPGSNGTSSLCAIGTMSPIIEVWDLDIVNCLEAAFTLGRKGSRRKGITAVGHRDAVLDLAWNKSFHHILASGSVDQTVLLWDLDQGAPHTTLKQFKDKVQCLKWHPFEAQTLLTGSCDKTVKVFDCRSKKSFHSWDTDGEVERIAWDPIEPFCFLASTNTGNIQSFDCRKGLLWSLEAHEKEVTGLVISPQCKGLMVTASSDEELKIWDYSYNNIPKLIHSKTMNIGMIQCLELSMDSTFVIATGGDNRSNNFSVIDLRTLEAVNQHFGLRPLVQLVKNETAENGDSMET